MKFKGNIYLLQSYSEEFGDVYKIGITKNEISERLMNLNTGNPNEIKVIHIYQSRINPRTLEARLHKAYDYCRIKGEWFDLPQDAIDKFILSTTIYENALIAIGKK